MYSCVPTVCFAIAGEGRGGGGVERSVRVY